MTRTFNFIFALLALLISLSLPAQAGNSPQLKSTSQGLRLYSENVYNVVVHRDGWRIVRLEDLNSCDRLSSNECFNVRSIVCVHILNGTVEHYDWMSGDIVVTTLPECYLGKHQQPPHLRNVPYPYTERGEK